MWLKLWLVWKCVAKPDEGILDVAWHGKMYLLLFVVPVECEYKVSCSFPVGVNFVVLLEDAHKMVNIVFVDVLHAKIVDNEGEADGVPVKLPVSWCDSALPVACFMEAFDEKFLRNDVGLWEAVQSRFHFAENIAVCIPFVTECIFIDDVMWEDFEFHPEILVKVHGHHEVEVLDVDSHEL